MGIHYHGFFKETLAKPPFLPNICVRLKF